MAPILVTGATGNVGSAVLRSLTAQGAETRVARRLGRAADQLPDGGVAFDFADPGTWSAAFEGVESMFLMRPPAIGNVRRNLLHSLGMPWGMVVVTSAIYTTARMGLAAGLTADVKAVLGRDPIDFAVSAHRQRLAWTHHLATPDSA